MLAMEAPLNGPTGQMFFRESLFADPSGVHTPVRGVLSERLAPGVAPELRAVPELPPARATVWQRMGDVSRLPASLGVVAGVEPAITEFAHWPAWMLLGCVPLGAMALRARRTSSVRQTIFMGILGAAAAGVALLAYSALAGSAPLRRAALPPPLPPLTAVPWTVTHTGHLAVREVIADDEGDVWAVANSRTLVELDSVSMSQLGVARRFGGRIQHAIECDNELLVTYGDGKIADVGSVTPGAVRSVTYGHPVDAGRLTGMMACGGGSVFVAMPLEAKVVRLAVPDLRVIARISVGELVSGLAYAGGTLFVDDARQAAVITVDLTTNVPWRWTSTTSAPQEIVGLRGEATLLAHTDAPCLGYVEAGARKEVGEDWSIDGGVRAVAVGSSVGGLVDGTGRVFLFDAETGKEVAAPIHVPFANEATSVALTADNHMIVAIPARHILVSIRPAAWTRLHAWPQPASNCLPAAE